MIENAGTYSLEGKSIWVTGPRGMVGQAIVRRLATEGCEILTADRKTVDQRRQNETEQWLEDNKPDAIVMSAAKVGGIQANNSYPADFIYDNLAIELNVIEGARKVGVEKLLMLGSSCIYPRVAPQPLQESSLLSGPLEPTNEWYAIAKIAGIKLCHAYRKQYGCNFIAAMPTNLYGTGDNFNLESSHVVPALMRKIHEAKEKNDKSVPIWGTGLPLREFMHVDDCADALIHLLKNYSGDEHVNVGTGTDVSIADLAQILADVIGFEGSFDFDSSKPDGTPRKLMDVSSLNRLGWNSRIELKEGLKSTYEWYVQNLVNQPDSIRQ